MKILIENAILLRSSGEQITFSEENVLIENDTISGIGKGRITESQNIDRVINGRGKLIMPGLVNAHIHSYDRFDKGRFDNLPLEVWLALFNPPLGKRDWTPQECYLRTMITAIEMVRNGTTTVLDDVPHGWPLSPEHIDAVFRAYQDIGMRAWVSIRHSDRPYYQGLPYLEELLPENLKSELPGKDSQANAEAMNLLRDYARRWDGRIRLMLAPGLVQITTDELLKSTWALSEELDLPVTVHVLETRAQLVTGRTFYGKSLVRHMAELGILTPRTVIAHAVWVDDEDIRLIADSGASIAHNPIANLKLGSGIAPVRKLLEAGINVGVGTDNNNANDTANMFESMKAVALLHKVRDMDYRRWVGADEAFRMSTIGGAHCAGMQQQLGILEIGYKADLVLLNLETSSFYPRNNLLNQIVFSEDGRSVDSVIVDGNILMENGSIITVNEKEIFTELMANDASIREKIRLATSRGNELEPYVSQAYAHCLKEI